MNILSGKHGFLNKHFGDRRVAFGTRNVLSADVIKSNHPDDPSILNYDESRLSILQAMKEFQPFVIHFLKKKVFGHVFSSTTTAKVIDKNFHVKYVDVKPKTLKRYTTNNGLNSIINEFKNIHFREKPISIEGINGKLYNVLVCHDSGDTVVIDVDITNLKITLGKTDIKFNKKYLRPVTYVEMLYIGIWNIVSNKHVSNNRYPVIGDGSIYPSKIHISSTVPDRKVRVVFGINDIELIHYPIFGNKYLDSLVVHTSRLPGLGGDHDGDTGSNIGIWTKEGNESIKRYMNSPKAYIDDTMSLKIKGSQDDIVAITVHNMSV
jgi:hypothetical protein